MMLGKSTMFIPKTCLPALKDVAERSEIDVTTFAHQLAHLEVRAARQRASHLSHMAKGWESHYRINGNDSGSDLLEVSTIFSGDIPWNLGLIYGRYLQVRILKWPNWSQLRHVKYVKIPYWYPLNHHFSQMTHDETVSFCGEVCVFSHMWENRPSRWRHIGWQS